jgi:hypothetical protein
VLSTSKDISDGICCHSQRMPNGNDYVGCNPFHFLAGGYCPFSSLKLMLLYCYLREAKDGSDPRLLRDDDGDPPLHWALAHGLSPRRLTMLLSECHDSLLCANNDGTLLMEEYVKHNCENFDFMNGDEKQGLWNNILAMLMIVTGYQGHETWSPLPAIASGVAFIPEAFWTMGLEFG